MKTASIEARDMVLKLSRRELLARHEVSQEAKIFVIDTNALSLNYRLLQALKDNIKVIPIKVLDELDRLKEMQSEQGRNVRDAIRYLDSLRKKGFLQLGQRDDVGGIVFVDYNRNDYTKLPKSMEKDDDAVIILTAIEWQDDLPEREVAAISEDLNFRLRADACFIRCEGRRDSNIKNTDGLYLGIKEILVKEDIINDLYKKKEIRVNGQDDFEGIDFSERNFFVLHHGSQSALVRCLGDNQLVLIPPTLGTDLGIGFKERNKEQRFAMELLLDPSITNVALSGTSGSGKTLLSLAAGLHQVEKGLYDRVIAVRPIVPVGNKELGYMPGAKKEKIEPWMEPILAKLEKIAFMKMLKEKKGKLNLTKKAEEITNRVNRLLDNGKVKLETLTFMRGAEIERSFVVIDEPQNLTNHEIKTIISRAGEGTKMVLAGDVFQIDTPYLTFDNNGLSVLIERFKDQPFFGHVLLGKSIRSTLAQAASELL